MVWGKTHLLRLHRGGFLCLVCLTLRRERREPGKPQPVYPHGGRSSLDRIGRRVATLLEALPAKHRSTLRRSERYGGFPATLGTLDGGFHPIVAPSQSLLAATLAGFTPFGLVPETLIREKDLLGHRKKGIIRVAQTAPLRPPPPRLAPYILDLFAESHHHVPPASVGKDAFPICPSSAYIFRRGAVSEAFRNYEKRLPRKE